jgi:hypothetical protein
VGLGFQRERKSKVGPRKTLSVRKNYQFAELCFSEFCRIKDL